MKRLVFTIVLLSLSACSSPQTHNNEGNEPEPKRKPLGLSCYFPEIADAENVQIMFNGREGSLAEKLVIETDMDGETVGVEVYKSLSLSDLGDWPLGTYTATVGTKTAVLKLTHVDPAPTDTSEYRGGFTNREYNDEPITCYRFERD